MKIIVTALFAIFLTMSLLAQGTLDTTFNGGTGYNSHPIPNEEPAGMDLQETTFQDRMVVATYVTDNTGSALNQIKVRRFMNNNGALDGSFGSGGVASFTPPSPITWTQATAMTVRDGSNRIFVGAQTDQGCIVVRFNANGTSPVMQYLPNPTGTALNKGRCLISALKIHSNRLYAVGTTFDGTNMVTTSWRLIPSQIGTPGAIDIFWGGNGWVRTQLKAGTPNIHSNGRSIAFSGNGASLKVWVVSSGGETTHPTLVEAYNFAGALIPTWGNTSTNISSTTPGGIHRLNLPTAPHWVSPLRALFAWDAIANNNFIFVGGAVSGPGVSGVFDYRLVRIPVTTGGNNYVYPDVDFCRADIIRKMEFSSLGNQLIVAGSGDGTPIDLTVAKYQHTGIAPILQNTWIAPSGSVLGTPSAPNPCPGTGDRRRISRGVSGMGFVGMGLQKGAGNINKIIVSAVDANNLYIYRMLP